MENLTDDQIRKILRGYGEDVPPINGCTRPVLLRKIARLTGVASSNNSPVPSSPPGPASSSTATEVPQSGTTTLDPPSSADEFYVVCVDEPRQHVVDQVYTSKDDALKAMSMHAAGAGARFKKFDTEKKARNFIEEGAHPQKTLGSHSLPLAVSEKANNYPSISTPELSEFREVVRNGDTDSFVKHVWRNPRYLISQSDSPVILKPSFHYNVLHCAVRSGSLEICKKLFEILEGDHFWSLVYPLDSWETYKKRRCHLIDLYLNMCEKGVSKRNFFFIIGN